MDRAVCIGNAKEFRFYSELEIYKGNFSTPYILKLVWIPRNFKTFVYKPKFSIFDGKWKNTITGFWRIPPRLSKGVNKIMKNLNQLSRKNEEFRSILHKNNLKILSIRT